MATGFGVVDDNGCNPCCASMVAENAAHLLPVQKACRLAIACGARDKPGTDIYVFVQTVGFGQQIEKILSGVQKEVEIRYNGDANL